MDWQGTMSRLAAQVARRIRQSRPTYKPVATPPILPRWFSNQWLTDSLVAYSTFHFLQCRARGAIRIPSFIVGLRGVVQSGFEQGPSMSMKIDTLPPFARPVPISANRIPGPAPSWQLVRTETRSHWTSAALADFPISPTAHA